VDDISLGSVVGTVASVALRTVRKEDFEPGTEGVDTIEIGWPDGTQVTAIWPVRAANPLPIQAQ
jgi:hypothetical protein